LYEENDDQPRPCRRQVAPGLNVGGGGRTTLVGNAQRAARRPPAALWSVPRGAL